MFRITRVVALSLGVVSPACTDSGGGSGTSTDTRPGSVTGTVTSNAPGSTSNTGASSSTQPPPPASSCQAPLKWFLQSGCPSRGDGVFSQFTAGCYQPCNEPNEVCATGYACSEVEFNPCPPPSDPSQPQCDACTMTGSKLCLPIAQGPDCAQFVGTYETPNERECGATPDGVLMCKWRLTFQAAGAFSWSFSDLSASGRFSCLDGQLYIDRGLPLGSPTATLNKKVDYDPTTGVITWENVAYHRVQP